MYMQNVRGKTNETPSNTYFMFPSQFSRIRCGKVNGVNIYSANTLLNSINVCVRMGIENKFSD